MTNNLPIKLIFMLEERSAEILLRKLLPQILPSSVEREFFSHHGKEDLQKSIPIKLKAWNTPNNFFVILHDLDNNSDCVKLKSELQSLCSKAKQHVPLIRIVCWELEAWYFGDLAAVEKAYPKFKANKYKNKSNYRGNPDKITRPSAELKKIFANLDIFVGKTRLAKEVSKYMDINGNKSPSFNCTVTGIKNLANTQLRGKN